MSRISLASIPSLTLYKDALTAARRTDAIPQLTCIGKFCNLYQPEVVRCTNLGGRGTDVDWKCEADLPEALRFGKVEVSCEGWSGPGDPYVLKGSCGLKYRLVKIPDALRNDNVSFVSRAFGWLRDLDSMTAIFYIVWFGILAFILYSLIKSCLRGSNGSPGRSTSSTSRPHGATGQPPGWFGGSGYSGGDDRDPPPPYSKYPSSSSQSTWWNPGFWTGAALGGLGAHLLNRRRAYDWEQERIFRAAPPPMSGYTSGWSSSSRRPPVFDSSDRGESSSGLGSARRSTGFGGTSVR